MITLFLHKTGASLMLTLKKPLLGLVAALLATCAISANAQVRVTEVAPWSSGNSPVGADWFELTNFGSSAIDITGWKVDDNSNSFASALALNGITSIAAGQSVIFLEGTATTATAFTSNWASGSMLVGYYSGSSIGLSTGSDAVNIYNAAGVLQANVAFGASDATSPYQTFDNAAGLNNTTISQLSVAGVNGAYLTSTGTEIGSPGSIAAVAAVPEPENIAMLLAGLGMVGAMVRRRRAA
jgi:hypothetical protein